MFFLIYSLRHTAFTVFRELWKEGYNNIYMFLFLTQSSGRKKQEEKKKKREKLIATTELASKLFWVFGLILRWDVASSLPLSKPGVLFQSALPVQIQTRGGADSFEMQSAGSKREIFLLVQIAEVEILQPFVFIKQNKQQQQQNNFLSTCFAF